MGGYGALKAEEHPLETKRNHTSCTKGQMLCCLFRFAATVEKSFCKLSVRYLKVQIGPSCGISLEILQKEVALCEMSKGPE